MLVHGDATSSGLCWQHLASKETIVESPGDFGVAQRTTPTCAPQRANIANGPQQVNNGAPVACQATRAGNQETEPNKLLEAPHERMDFGTAGAAVSGNSKLAPVGTFHRATKRRR